MTTMKKLAKTLAGEVFASVMWVLIATLQDTIEWGYVDFDVIKSLVLYFVVVTPITIALTYIGYHVRNGVAEDIQEFKNRKLKRIEMNIF